MARSFLIRGMLCGIVAGLLVFLFAKFFGEPSVDGAIGVEDAIAKAAGDAPEPELVSRAVQASWGLLTGTMLYSIAVGGLFSLVFAVCVGPLGAAKRPRNGGDHRRRPRLVTIYLVPNLKYPANPPSVGHPDTIGYRTALYFGMIVISIAGGGRQPSTSAKSFVGRFDKWHSRSLFRRGGLSCRDHHRLRGDAEHQRGPPAVSGDAAVAVSVSLARHATDSVDDARAVVWRVDRTQHGPQRV